MVFPRWPVDDEVDDQAVARLLIHHALIEIRVTARRARGRSGTSTDEALGHISFLSDLAHNLPAATRPPSRSRTGTRFHLAVRARPMSWTWHTSGAEGQEWMLRHIADAGFRWSPPPPLPRPRKNHVGWTVRRRLAVLGGWPVSTPSGQDRSPRQARVLKMVDRDQIYAWIDNAVLRAHLDPDAPHYIFPVTANPRRPGDGPTPWQCQLLIRMIDGERIHSSVTVSPAEFLALPDNVSRFRQRRLVLRAQMLERDYGLWSREHRERCSPERCGYPGDG